MQYVTEKNSSRDLWRHSSACRVRSVWSEWTSVWRVS